MQAPMRRQDRKLTDQQALAILEKGEYGVLSMCTPDNQGYGVPVSYVLWNNALYFHGAGQGTKLSNLKNNNKVSFCVVGHTQVLPAKFSMQYESAIVSGTTSEVEGDEKRQALVKFIEKYSGEFLQQGIQYIDKQFDNTLVLKLTITTLTGKAKKP